jgi:regulatory protein
MSGLHHGCKFLMEQKITALKAQKRNPNRVNIYLDGIYAFSASRIVAAWLEVGQVLEEDKIASLKMQDSKEIALEKALHFISYRSRSENEVQQKLKEKGFSEIEIDEVLERLRTTGLVADSQFARNWVEDRSTFRPRSRRLMTMELHQKGVADEDISSALAEVEDDDTLAYQAASRYARRLEGLEWDKFRMRLGAYLGRRGFSYGTTAPVVRRVWLELHSLESDE